MMQCKNKRESTKETHGETRTIWKSSRASVSGPYNTPPLREDLVPRSRMAPEKNGRGRGKTKLLLDKRVNPKNLERLNNLKKNMDMNEIANTPLDKRNKEHH